jgi:hypothetical protein
MVNYIHCPSCRIESEIRTINDEVFEEPIYCPYCGHAEETGEELDEELYDDGNY